MCQRLCKQPSLNLTCLSGRKTEAPWHLTQDMCTIRTKSALYPVQLDTSHGLSQESEHWSPIQTCNTRALTRRLSTNLRFWQVTVLMPSIPMTLLFWSFLKEGAGDTAKNHILHLKDGSQRHVCTDTRVGSYGAKLPDSI